MKKLILPLVMLLSGFASLFAQEDIEGSKDPALFTRMPDHYISDYADKEFEKFEFQTGDTETQTIEGHFYFIQYSVKENTQIVSGLQVTRNDANAVKNIGGKYIYDYHDGSLSRVTLKPEKGELRSGPRSIVPVTDIIESI